MNDKVKELIQKAKKIYSSGLQKEIDALEALGEKATGRNKEYKELFALVEQYEATVAAEGEEPKEPEKQEKPEDQEKEPEIPAEKKLNYSGIRQIGAKFCSKKNNYQEPRFDNPEDCAKHYNGE